MCVTHGECRGVSSWAAQVGLLFYCTLNQINSKDEGFCMIFETIPLIGDTDLLYRFFFLNLFQPVYASHWSQELNFPVLPLGFLDGLGVKNLLANARDASSILGLGGSPGEGNGNSFQYSCLKNSMDRGG